MGIVKLKIKSIPVTIDTEYIRLDSFLKLSGAVGTGGQAKFEIQSGAVELDGKVCTLRGKKVRGGQRVRYGNKTYEIISTAIPSGKETESPIQKESKTTGARTPFSKNISSHPHKGSNKP